MIKAITLLPVLLVITMPLAYGYAGSAENYIYTKALNECIDPKMQERIDKVKA